MDSRIIKLLLVEPDVEDAMLVKEALMEIEERQRGRIWSPLFQPVHVERLEDALDVLAEDPFDVILLDVHLPDSHSLHGFLRLREVSADAAILLLAHSDDDALAISAVREGAQDFLLKWEIDSRLLARAIRNAEERQRVLSAARSDALRDPHSGFYSARAFQELGARDFWLASRSASDQTVAIVEVDGLPGSAPARGAGLHLLRLDAAEAIRKCCEPTDLLGAEGETRFAVARLGSADAWNPIGARLRNALANLAPGVSAALGEASLLQSGARSFEELVELAARALCENRRKIESHDRNVPLSVA
jgi:DNA-binding NarL/FixJ family response regulator